MRKESLIHKILRKLGFIKDIEDDREFKMEMCKRAIKANVCPEDCDICAWDVKGGASDENITIVYFLSQIQKFFNSRQKRRSKMNNQQAIDRLVKHLEWGWSEETVEAIKMGIHALEETKWIPCSEKMPEESGFYMASVYCEVTKESHCRSVWFTFDDDPYAEMEWRELPSYEKVVAWMPLPEPYKGE